MAWGRISLFTGFPEKKKKKTFGSFDCDFRKSFTQVFFLTEYDEFRNFRFDSKFSIFTDSRKIIVLVAHDIKRVCFAS